MAAFKRMLQVGMKAENCLLRYRALKAHLSSSSSSSKEPLKRMRSRPEHEAADFDDDWERRKVEFFKMMESDMAKHFAAVEKINRETMDYYKSLNEARKKQLRKVGIGFAVFMNGFFVAAAMRESFQGVLGRSP